MATGALDANGIWQYGEDDSNTTFSALINRLGSSTSAQVAADRARLANLELSGRVVQVAYGYQDTQVNTTAGYPGVSTNLSVSITPRYNNSRILIIVSQYIQPVSLANSFDGGFGIFRNNSVDLGGNSLSTNAATGAGGTLAIRHLASMVRDDFPNTTSSVSYNTKMWLSYGLRYEAQPSNQRSTITAIEIKV